MSKYIFKCTFKRLVYNIASPFSQQQVLQESKRNSSSRSLPGVWIRCVCARKFLRMILNHSELDTQNLVVINCVDRSTVNFKKINFVTLNCVDSAPSDCPAANQMPVEIMKKPAYAHQSIGQSIDQPNDQDSHPANVVDIHATRPVDIHPAHSPDFSRRHALNNHPASSQLSSQVSSQASSPASSPVSSDPPERSSGGDSLPILNTPDSGINHSRNSLNGEMATSNRTHDDDRTSASPDSELNDPLNSQLNSKLNNDLNSNQLNDSISQHIKNGKMDYGSEDKVHFDFLTASQLQKIVSIHRKFSENFFESKSNSLSFRLTITKDASKSSTRSKVRTASRRRTVRSTIQTLPSNWPTVRLKAPKSRINKCPAALAAV